LADFARNSERRMQSSTITALADGLAELER